MTRDWSDGVLLAWKICSDHALSKIDIKVSRFDQHVPKGLPPCTVPHVFSGDTSFHLHHYMSRIQAIRLPDVLHSTYVLVIAYAAHRDNRCNMLPPMALGMQSVEALVTIAIPA